MRGPLPLPFRPGALAFALLLSGCMEMATRADGLYFRPPVAAGAASIATALAPDDVAETLRAAGFRDVRVLRDGTVRLRSDSPAFVDCGALIQVALGNEAEFPGTAPKAVLISGFATPGLFQRTVRTASEVRLTPLPEGGYAVDESHRVTRSLVSLSTRARSTKTITFDETSTAAFPDKTSCRSAGLIPRLLG